jgi:hypothetical protein
MSWSPFTACRQALRVLSAPRGSAARILEFPSGSRSAYILTLALIGPLGRFLSQGIIGIYAPATVVFGTEIPGEWIRAPRGAVLDFLCGLGVGLGAFAFFAWMLVRLAPKFNARIEREDSLRAAALILTPIYLANGTSLLASVPFLSALPDVITALAIAHAVALGLWSLPLLSTPREKVFGHLLSALGPTVTAALSLFGVLQWLLM